MIYLNPHDAHLHIQEIGFTQDISLLMSTLSFYFRRYVFCLLYLIKNLRQELGFLVSKIVSAAFKAFFGKLKVAI